MQAQPQTDDLFETVLVFTCDDGTTWETLTGEAAFERVDDPDLGEHFFADSEDEIPSKLDAMQADRPIGTTMVMKGRVSRRIPKEKRDVSWRKVEDVEVWKVSRWPILKGGTDVETVLAHAKQHGETIWNPSQLEVERKTNEWERKHYGYGVTTTCKANLVTFGGDRFDTYDLKALKDAIRPLGFLVVGNGNEANGMRIRYAPKVAKRQAGKAAKAATTFTQMKPLVGAVLNALPNELRNSVTSDPSGGFVTLVDGELRTAIALINSIAGKNAHRRTAAFQELRAVWRANLVNNRKHTDKLGDFVAWMEAECRARAIPPSRQVRDFKMNTKLPW